MHNYYPKNDFMQKLHTILTNNTKENTIEQNCSFDNSKTILNNWYKYLYNDIQQKINNVKIINYINNDEYESVTTTDDSDKSVDLDIDICIESLLCCVLDLCFELHLQSGLHKYFLAVASLTVSPVFCLSRYYDSKTRSYKRLNSIISYNFII